MKLEQSFTVDAPLDRVWEALVDVERVAPCLPGAQITGSDADGTYHGEFTVKLGPTTAAYRGSLKMEQLDERAHTATMKAHGSDKRGQGGASATIVSTVVAEGAGTRVDTVTDFTITGRLARFGRGGMIEDVSRRLMRDFAGCLQQSLGAQQAAQPAAATAAAAAEGAAASAAQPVSPPPPAAPAQAKPVHGIRLILGALWDRIRRMLRRER
jgi:uncharacterized protein